MAVDLCAALFARDVPSVAAKPDIVMTSEREPNMATRCRHLRGPCMRLTHDRRDGSSPDGASHGPRERLQLKGSIGDAEAITKRVAKRVAARFIE